MSVRLSVRMNDKISETIGATILGLRGARLFQKCATPFFTPTNRPKLWLLQSCHAHSNAHKPTKTVAPTVVMLDRKF